MRISRKQKINNTPILKIRDFFKSLQRYRTDTFTLDKACNYFEINDIEANSLLNELSEQGFIEKSISDYYKTTLKGEALRIARCEPPIKRDKADKIVKDFMQRVEEINNNDYYLYRVSKVLLFGSYINKDAVDFGDIDIAFELERKIKDAGEYEKLNEEFIEKAKDKGKYFSSFIDELFYSETVVLMKLINRNRYISLHRDDEILKVTVTKQIYPVEIFDNMLVE
jgi:predicted nucleotidyltransferase